ncbi:MAG: hypothetical protein ACP5I3_10020 [Thermoproteus sp.]
MRLFSPKYVNQGSEMWASYSLFAGVLLSQHGRLASHFVRLKECSFLNERPWRVLGFTIFLRDINPESASSAKPTRRHKLYFSSVVFAVKPPHHPSAILDSNYSRTNSEVNIWPADQTTPL